MFEKYALISLSDKSNLEVLLDILKKKNYKLIATSSTAITIRELGYECQFLENITAYPEIFDGRVKTLQPEIHGGILADLSNERHLKDLSNYNINPISLVVCNLYPFEQVLESERNRHNQLIENTINDIDIVNSLSLMSSNIIENIDIGGVTLIRGAAKNYKNVSILCNPSDYDDFASKLESDSITIEYRKHLAMKAYIHTANYDSIIANYFMDSVAEKEEIPQLLISAKLKEKLRYGENPHQEALYFETNKKVPFSINSSTILQGKQLSYNNYLDIDAAYQAIVEFDTPCAIALKHNTPCGIGFANNIIDAYLNCYNVDSTSIFGGIVILNDTVNKELAYKLSEIFLEIVIAPTFSDEALEVFKDKKNLRIIKGDFSKSSYFARQVRSINGGYLIQDDMSSKFNLDVVTNNSIDEININRLKRLYQAIKIVKSNAIIIGQEDNILGISGGMVSRIDACNFAIDKAIKNQCYDENKPLLLASDGFFPFNDIVDLAIKFNIKYIIHPGGSINDEKLINACNENNISVAVTKIRFFRH